ncbi:hypothetical protein ACTMSW_05740 [Micromonospora sp. BQ11]|uniref:hypothetical protein n=1 Tax=Micromonospora sp. BQ11 TaxID=3452212 RepID=UPI003F8AA7ED
MNRSRFLPVILTCVSLMALAACGAEQTGTTTGAAPSATAQSAIAPSAAAPSPTPASPSAAAVPTTATVSDKKLCETAKRASADMKETLTDALKSGEALSPALFGKVLSGLEKKMTTAATTGDPASPVTAALNAFGAEAGEAAKAADPATAAANPAFEKAGTALSTACRKAGVAVTF